MVLCADTSLSNEQMQRRLFSAFFKHVHYRYIDAASDNLPDSNPCRWHGIVCSSGTVSKIRIRKWDLGPLQISYLPNSAQYVGIESCSQEHPLDTRLLPLELRALYLQDNLIYGTLDFPSLPSRLVVLNMSRNSLSGKLLLTKLPESIECIILWGNPCCEGAVLYKHLPDSIFSINLWNNAQRGGRHRVRPTKKKYAVDAKIFAGTRTYYDPYYHRDKSYWLKVYKQKR